MNGEMKIGVDFIQKKDYCALVDYRTLVITAEFKWQNIIH